MPQVETFILPVSWACAYANADLSGYNDEEIAAMEALDKELIEEFGNAHLIPDPEDSEGFCKSHDAYHVYPYAADCINYALLYEEKRQ